MESSELSCIALAAKWNSCSSHSYPVEGFVRGFKGSILGDSLQEAPNGFANPERPAVG